MKIKRLLNLKYYHIDNTSEKLISEENKEENILISGKKDIKYEYLFLKTQLQKKEKLINLFEIKNIKIIDCMKGAVMIENNRLIFILIPRIEIENRSKNKEYIKCLKKIEEIEEKYKSHRGNDKKVYFETRDTNYINMGIGTCRGKKGLYLRHNKKISEKIYNCIINYNKVTSHICQKYIPSSLLKTLSKTMKQIDMEYFNDITQYSEKNLKIKKNPN